MYVRLRKYLVSISVNRHSQITGELLYTLEDAQHLDYGRRPPAARTLGHRPPQRVSLFVACFPERRSGCSCIFPFEQLATASRKAGCVDLDSLPNTETKHYHVGDVVLSASVFARASNQMRTHVHPLMSFLRKFTSQDMKMKTPSCRTANH